MAGKVQKAAGALQFTRGGRLERRGPALHHVTDEPRRVPPCPQGLHRAARLAWRSFWLSPAGAVTPYEAHEAALRHWVAYVSERAYTEEGIATKPVTTGAMGQEALNPLVGYLKELNRKIEKYEEQFGMQPLNAMRLNIAEVQRAAGVYDLTRKLERPDDADADAVIDLDALS